MKCDETCPFGIPYINDLRESKYVGACVYCRLQQNKHPLYIGWRTFSVMDIGTPCPVEEKRVLKIKELMGIE